MTDARDSSALHSLFQRALLKSLTFSRKSHQSLPKTNVNCGSWDRGPIKGKAYFRLESVQKFQPTNTGAVPDLGVNSAKRADGTITVIIVNKNIEEAVPVHLKIVGTKPRKNAARAWLLSGPSPIANNLKDPNAISISQTTVSVRKDSYYLRMPACSMAAIEIAP